MYAIEAGKLATAIHLIEKHGADPLTRTRNGETPLLRAVNSGASKEVVEQFLKYGCDPDVETEYGWTPLSLAIGKVNQESAGVLAAASKYGLKYKNQFHQSILTMCAETCILPAVELLVKLGIDVNEKDGNGRSALSYAVQGHPELCLEVVEFLTSQEGVDMKNIDSEGRDLLEWACRTSSSSPFLEAWEADTEDTREILMELLKEVLETKAKSEGIHLEDGHSAPLPDDQEETYEAEEEYQLTPELNENGTENTVPILR